MLNDNALHFSVKTRLSLSKDPTIELSTICKDSEGISSTIFRKVIRLEDQAIRAALIKLGWTPPAPGTHVWNEDKICVLCGHSKVYFDNTGVVCPEN